MSAIKASPDNFPNRGSAVAASTVCCCLTSLCGQVSAKHNRIFLCYGSGTTGKSLYTSQLVRCVGMQILYGTCKFCDQLVNAGCHIV